MIWRKSLIQYVAGGAALIVGGLYTVGLIVVNLDLARYGIVDLDLARPEYVLAGALWAFWILASFLLGLQATSEFERRLPPSRSSKLSSNLARAVSQFAFVAVFVMSPLAFPVFFLTRFHQFSLLAMQLA
jgi:hypothetical protein